jgi:hypothetical protein
MDRQETLFDLDAGERAKERGMDLASSSDRAWDWRRRAEVALYELAETGKPFTADDVVAVVGLPDLGPGRNNAVGAMFSAAAKRGWIVRVGYRKATRVLSHGRVVAVWAGSEELP